MQLHKILEEKLNEMSSEEFEELNKKIMKLKKQGLSTEQYLKKVAELLEYDKMSNETNKC